MLNVQMAFSAAMLSIFLVTAASCNEPGQYPRGGPYYYTSFANYEIPFRPTGEISSDKAKTLEAYYVAYFNEQGKIASFTKYLQGKVEFSDKYIYGADGLLECRELTKANGEVSTQYFDKNGKIINDRSEKKTR